MCSTLHVQRRNCCLSLTVRLTVHLDVDQAPSAQISHCSMQEAAATCGGGYIWEPAALPHRGAPETGSTLFEVVSKWPRVRKRSCSATTLHAWHTSQPQLSRELGMVHFAATAIQQHLW